MGDFETSTSFFIAFPAWILPNGSSLGNAPLASPSASHHSDLWLWLGTAAESAEFHASSHSANPKPNAYRHCPQPNAQTPPEPWLSIHVKCCNLFVFGRHLPSSRAPNRPDPGPAESNFPDPLTPHYSDGPRADCRASVGERAQQTPPYSLL